MQIVAGIGVEVCQTVQSLGHKTNVFYIRASEVSRGLEPIVRIVVLMHGRPIGLRGYLTVYNTTCQEKNQEL